MLEFLSVYGGTVLASILSAAILGVMRWFISNQKKQQKVHDEELVNQMQEYIKAAVAKEQTRAIKEDKDVREELKKTNSDMTALKKGVLSIQGPQFRAKCKEYLEPDHELTQEEFCQLTADHDAYNALGGNHLGDLLFATVKEKFVKTFGTTNT